MRELRTASASMAGRARWPAAIRDVARREEIRRVSDCGRDAWRAGVRIRRGEAVTVADGVGAFSYRFGKLEVGWVCLFVN